MCTVHIYKRNNDLDLWCWLSTFYHFFPHSQLNIKIVFLITVYLTFVFLFLKVFLYISPECSSLQTYAVHCSSSCFFTILDSPCYSCEPLSADRLPWSVSSCIAFALKHLQCFLTLCNLTLRNLSSRWLEHHFFHN